MTPDAFAASVDARKSGRNKWMARCPAHQDRAPSMSISEGRDGRVLLFCFAGCALDAILAALKLSRHDLYAGPPPSPVEAASLRTARKQCEQKARDQRKASREAWDRVRRWEAVVNTLGAKLAHAPDDAPEGDALTRTFHAACERLSRAQIAAATICELKEAA